MKEYLEIELWYIVVVLFSLFCLYVFTTGYECGFGGKCWMFDAGGNLNKIRSIWQGDVRLIISLFSGIGIFSWLVVEILDGKSFTIKNPFYDENKSEAWDEYQQWLKERKK